jgi:hypothetical protein
VSYLLDANVFIQAKNLHYGLDFCPAFWHWLLEKHGEGLVLSIDKVSDELLAGADDLADWAREQASGLFSPTDATVIGHLGQVSAWVMNEQYEPAAINTFFQVADFYLVGHALAGAHTVVTHEKPENSRRRVKIPNVCAGMGLRFMTPFQMLRTERANFVLGPAR